MPRELTEFQREYLARKKAEREEALAENADVIERFRTKCNGLCIDADQIKFDYRQTTGIVAAYPNLLSYLNPELKIDKDGLVSLTDLKREYALKPMSHGYFHSSDYTVLASHFFRRGMHRGNGYAPRLIEFLSAIEDDKLETSIRVDFDEVRIDQSGTYVELDTWYGATFDKNIAEVKGGNVKLVPPPSFSETDLLFFFNNTIALTIEWKEKTEEGVTFKNFQAEEFKTADSLIEFNDDIYHPARYLHAEYDFTGQYFRHFDGAIHFYSSEDYEEVRYSDFNHNNRNTKHVKGDSIKLFRIDGELAVNDWIEYVSQFFTGNPLVIEYCEGQLPENIRNMVAKKSKSDN